MGMASRRKWIKAAAKFLQLPTDEAELFRSGFYRQDRLDLEIARLRSPEMGMGFFRKYFRRTV